MNVEQARRLLDHLDTATEPEVVDTFTEALDALEQARIDLEATQTNWDRDVLAAEREASELRELLHTANQQLSDARVNEANWHEHIDENRELRGQVAELTEALQDVIQARDEGRALRSEWAWEKARAALSTGEDAK